jgi:phosphatidylglycerophosphatase A
MTRLFTIVFGAGLLRPAPGTWGSLVALPLAYGLHLLGGFWLLLGVTVLVSLLGWAAVAVETRGKGDHDPSEIVIDEVAGQWIALFPVSYGAAMMSANVLNLWPGVVAAFLLFRLFDITKPYIIGKADRRGDALGVMLDDIIAGIFAAVGVVALAALAHLVLL